MRKHVEKCSIFDILFYSVFWKNLSFFHTYTQVMLGAAQQGVHGVILDAFKEVSYQTSIPFHVSNRRLHGLSFFLIAALMPRFESYILTSIFIYLLVCHLIIRLRSPAAA